MQWIMSRLSTGWERPANGALALHYNAWMRSSGKLPWDRLAAGDDVFILDRRGLIAWGPVVFIHRLEYSSKKDLAESLDKCGWGRPENEQYLDDAPATGVCLAYHIDPAVLSEPVRRPAGWSMPRLGWHPVFEGDDVSLRWVADARGSPTSP